jgi:hypothetical protein
MTALASLSDIVNRRTGGNSGTPEDILFYKVARLQGGTAPVATVVGRWTSLWGYAGMPSGVDVSTPPSTTPSNPTNATTGTLKQANPGGGRQKWLLGVDAWSDQLGTLFLYDRLMQMGGLDGTVASAQTITGGTTSRYTAGDGNMLFLEIYTAVGATATTVVASYTNQAGTASRTTVAVVFGGTGWNEVGRMIPLPLAAGDTGVRSVQSVTLTASTLTAGNFGVTIAHPILSMPISAANAGIARDTITGNPTIPEIQTNAALALAWFSGATSAPNIYGQTHTVEA